MGQGNMEEEAEVLHWLLYQRHFEALPEINRYDLDDLITDSDYLAVLFFTNVTDEMSARALRRASLIAEDAATFGIPIAKMSDNIIAKKYGIRNPPGLVLFRRGRHILYDEEDLEDEEDMLDWLTSPENMILKDQIEVVNRKMLERMRENTKHLAVLFFSETDCKQCERVLSALEEIDDEADENGIAFVRIDDWDLAANLGVHALPALLYFPQDSEDGIIYAGDLRSSQRILEWLLLRKDPTGNQMQEVDGAALRELIGDEDNKAVVVYFYNQTLCMACDSDSSGGSKRRRRQKQDDISDEEQEELQKARLQACAECREILERLENVDDEVARGHGVQFLRTFDLEFAQSVGVNDFPALVYFEKGQASVFEGDLAAEEDVLHWIVEHKTESRIELITRGMLEQALKDTHYLAVFFYKQPCRACDTILIELENIDDECDTYGIHMVKIADPALAKRYGITTFPALLYFRNGNPLLYDGDLKHEEAVLDWLTDDDNRELADEIEAVNEKMLEKLTRTSPFLAVFFYDEEECGEECDNILLILEEIDDEADAFGIDMVKVTETETATAFNVLNLPSLVYFRRGNPLFYEGDLNDSQGILGWLTSEEAFHLKDEVEEVNRRMLEKILDEHDFVAVFFYDGEADQDMSEVHAEMLSAVDAETENLNMFLLKISDVKYGRKWGVTRIPSLVYFRRKFPSIYRGELNDIESILEWLTKNRYKQPELNLFMFSLFTLSCGFLVYTLFYLFVFKSPEYGDGGVSAGADGSFMAHSE